MSNVFNNMLFDIKKIAFSGLFIISFMPSFGQPGWSRESLLAKLNMGNKVPDKLLADRSVVFYTPSYSYQQLQDVQRFFQQTGVDAVAYFTFDNAFANRDATKEAARYFGKRKIAFLVFLYKKDNLFSMTFTRFNNQPDLFGKDQQAWTLADADLNSLLRKVYRAAIQNQPKKNLLIIDQPETELPLKVVKGKSFAFFSVDLKVDRLAVPWFGEARSDSVLFHFFKENYPLQFGMVDGDDDPATLRKKGFLYKLNYVYAGQSIAKTILNYPTDADKNQALALNPEEGSKRVYKFYVQHLFSGDAFLGTRWDADMNWEEGLKNYIGTFKKELGL